MNDLASLYVLQNEQIHVLEKEIKYLKAQRDELLNEVKKAREDIISLHEDIEAHDLKSVLYRLHNMDTAFYQAIAKAKGK